MADHGSPASRMTRYLAVLHGLLTLLCPRFHSGPRFTALEWLTFPQPWKQAANVCWLCWPSRDKPEATQSPPSNRSQVLRPRQKASKRVTDYSAPVVNRGENTCVWSHLRPEVQLK